MKNKSLQYPFPTLDDKMFDVNKDGQLDSFETFFRDMHLDEMNRKSAELWDKESEKSSQSIHFKRARAADDENLVPIEDGGSHAIKLLVAFLVIMVLLGGLIFSLVADVNGFIRAAVMLAAVVISILLVKLVSVLK